MGSAKKIIEAAGVKIKWTDMEMGHEAKAKTGVYISDAHVDAFGGIKVLFKGPLTVPPSDSKSYVEIKGRRFTSGNQVGREGKSLLGGDEGVCSAVGHLCLS